MPENEVKAKSSRGRKPIEYSQEELEKPPVVVLVCGETNVGKTYRNIREIEKYMSDNPNTGRKAKKVLIFDVNDDDYTQYQTVSPFHIKALTNIQARRIRPLTKTGGLMTDIEKRDIVERMVKQYKNGLLVFEDLDKYMVGAKGQTIISLLTTYRHGGLDIMICHQSIAKISPTEFQNCTWIRVHQQVDDPAKYKGRIPNYFIVKIATMIVEEQYMAAVQAFEEDKISEQEHIIQKSFFVHVDMRRLRIRNCSKEAFIRACKRYIDTEEESKVRRMMRERDIDDQLIYKRRSDAVINLIGEYLRHWEDNYETPFG